MLGVAALLGVPVSAAAFGFLALVHALQDQVFTGLPRALGFHGTPDWWPVPVLAVAGLLVAPVIRHLPGTAGHEPSAGMSASGFPAPAELPGVLLAALASLALGVVLGPEAPLIALGGGLALAVVRAAGRHRELPARAGEVVASAGAFAAVATLLGSPLTGAFLLMEASGLGGALLGAVLVPGLLAAGTGALIFTGLGSWTGLGTYSLTLHHVPATRAPDAAQFGWALVVGLAAALAGTAVKRLARWLLPRIAGRRLPLTVAAGLVVGATAALYGTVTGHSLSDVLYSGQNALDPLLAAPGAYSVGALLLLMVCKAFAYGVSLSAFRGGPIFPSMFIGAVGGVALSRAGGLPLAAGFAMGIGAMCVAMLDLPMTSVLLATLLLGRPGLTVLPLVIVAVVVSYVASARLAPPPRRVERGG
ncbi:chloride channel protein [Streptomyces sp. SL13]|uniref:Chloride channel protein n=1 Tax=Streptantibioticus silvisoli TaxID=2705255 RepID=A0AA90H1N1_9ACTN|nr:chloride channel protein [Streptantibioticus silvisoli]MDI5968980.1 chloride channel protein [Streptantibioticus silvisoli]